MKDANNSGLIAPNGKPSNLTPEQYRLVRTPAFKKWFGDWENSPETASKVVDENGEPMVVYHGTSKKFTKFAHNKKGSNTGWDNTKLGFFFIDKKKLAEDFIAENGDSEKYYIIDTFLSIKKPIDITQKGIFSKKDQASDLVDILYQNKLPYEQALEFLKEEIGLGDIQDVMEGISYSRKEFIKKGFDGVLSDFGDNNTEYVAFHPEQIKLADGSNTTFDGGNSNMRFNDGGLVASILEEMINSDIIDEEHPMYNEVKSALDSKNQEEIKNVLEEMINSGIIDRSSPYYKKSLKAIADYDKELNNYLKTQRDIGKASNGAKIDESIARGIMDNLGGMGKIKIMTGANTFIALQNGVSFRLPYPRTNYVKITLSGLDLYDLEVGRIRAGKYTIVETKTGLYDNMLRPALEKATGLTFRPLFKNGGPVMSDAEWRKHIQPMIENLNKSLENGSISVDQYQYAISNLKNPKTDDAANGRHIDNEGVVRVDKPGEDFEDMVDRISEEALERSGEKDKEWERAFPDDEFAKVPKHKKNQWLKDYYANLKAANGKNLKSKYAEVKDYWLQLYEKMSPKSRIIYHQQWNRIRKNSDWITDKHVAEYIQGEINEYFDESFTLKTTDVSPKFFELGYKYIAYRNARNQPEFWDEAADGIKVGTGVFGGKENWRVTASGTDEIGVYPKDKYTKEQAEKLFSETPVKKAEQGKEIDPDDVKADAAIMTKYFNDFNTDTSDQDQVRVRTLKDGSGINIYTNNWTESNNPNSVNAIHWGKDNANLMSKEQLIQHIKNINSNVVPVSYAELLLLSNKKNLIKGKIYLATDKQLYYEAKSEGGLYGPIDSKTLDGLSRDYHITMEDIITGHGEPEEDEEEEARMARVFRLTPMKTADNGRELATDVAKGELKPGVTRGVYDFKNQEIWFNDNSNAVWGRKKGTFFNMAKQAFAERMGAEDMDLVKETDKDYVFELVGNQTEINAVAAQEGNRNLDFESWGSKKRVTLPKELFTSSEFAARFPAINFSANGSQIAEQPAGESPNKTRSTPMKIVTFKNKNNPRLVIIVKAYPNMSIFAIENLNNIRFPYVVGQTLNMGHTTWACNNGYLVNNEDPCPEKKIFGMRAKDIPQGHPFRTIYPGKFK